MDGIEEVVVGIELLLEGETETPRQKQISENAS